ncbi:hypothetical protein J6590_035275 [Homalodisca vitripennis]|nr:hypothetical protein J6590_035275 [Homalodisca vitripennis]
MQPRTLTFLCTTEYLSARMSTGPTVITRYSDNVFRLKRNYHKNSSPSDVGSLCIVGGSSAGKRAFCSGKEMQSARWAWLCRGWRPPCGRKPALPWIYELLSRQVEKKKCHNLSIMRTNRVL